MAPALAGRRARVTVIDRNAEGAARVASDIGGNALILDGTDDAAGAALDAAVGRTGPLRGLVNCAGIGGAARIVGARALDAFERTIRVNPVGTFNTLRLAAARMQGNAPDANGRRCAPAAEVTGRRVRQGAG